MSENVTELMTYCPRCQRLYRDPSFRFCLHDGTALEKALPEHDQGAATLKMPAYLAEEFPLTSEEGCWWALGLTMKAFGKPLMTMAHIISIAPRAMTDEQVHQTVAKLVEDGIIGRQSIADGNDLYFFPGKLGRGKTE